MKRTRKRFAMGKPPGCRHSPPAGGVRWAGVIEAGEQGTGHVAADLQPRFERVDRAGDRIFAKRYGHDAPRACLPVLLLAPDQQEHALVTEGHVLDAELRQIDSAESARKTNQDD